MNLPQQEPYLIRSRRIPPMSTPHLHGREAYFHSTSSAHACARFLLHVTVAPKCYVPALTFGHRAP
jgi:hypothetical protein